MTPRATGYKSEYPVTLSDGIHTVGLMTQSKTGIRRLPRGPGVERKAIRQNNWTGGRGNERLSTDTTRFFESTNLWSTVQGQVCNGPLRCMADVPAFNAHVTAYPTGGLMQRLPPGAGIHRKLTIPAGGGFTSVSVSFIARKQGAPANDLTVRLREDNAGAPGTVLQTATLSTASVTDVELISRVLNMAQELTAGASYWLTFSSIANSLTGSWYLLCDAAGAPYSRLSAASTDRKKVKFFEYKRGLYALCVYRDGSTAAKLLRNGDRGIATDAPTTPKQSTTTLVDHSKNWIVNEWAGCVVMITANMNKGEYRPIVSNTATTLTLGGDPWPQACGVNNGDGAGASEYVILGSEKWTEITGHGLGAKVTDVCVFNNKIYFAQGSYLANGSYTADKVMRRMQETNKIVASTGTWTAEFADDGDNRADYLVAAPHWDGTPSLWSANNYLTRAAVAKMPSNDGPWGVNLSFTVNGMTVGDKESLINSIIEYNNSIYCGKEDSVWQEKDGSFKKIPLGVDKARDERNNASMIWWNTQIFTSLLGGLERLYGTTLDDMGPDRDQGMIAARRGNIVDMVNVANMLYCSYSSPAGNSSVMVTTDPGGDWHNLVTLGFNSKSTGIFYQTVPGKANRLWIADRYNLWYCIMPDELHNPTRDSNMRYAPESFLTTAWIDADTPELNHFFDELRLSTRNLNTTTRTIEIEYQLDDALYEDAWTPFYRPPTTGEDYAAVHSPYQLLTVGDGDVTGRRIRFRFRLNCDGQTPAILNAWELRLNTLNEVLYDYLFDLRLADRMELMNGNDTTDNWSQTMAVLESWKESPIPLTLRTPMPGTAGVFDNIRGHIDPVSLVTQEWNDKETKLSGQIVFKQT